MEMTKRDKAFLDIAMILLVVAMVYMVVILLQVTEPPKPEHQEIVPGHHFVKEQR